LSIIYWPGSSAEGNVPRSLSGVKSDVRAVHSFSSRLEVIYALEPLVIDSKFHFSERVFGESENVPCDLLSSTVLIFVTMNRDG